MGLQPDHWIAQMVEEHRMIEPFEGSQVKDGVISYGVSSYGYDFRLSHEYKIPEFGPDRTLDPKSVMQQGFRDHRGDGCLIAPGSFVLGRSLEYFRIPRNVLTLCSGKSTYARCGVVVNVTPFEPEWEGFATVSLSNTGPSPVRVHSGEGIAQLVFLTAETECRTSYADRKGRYQAQKAITVSKIDGGEAR